MRAVCRPSTGNMASARKLFSVAQVLQQLSDDEYFDDTDSDRWDSLYQLVYETSSNGIVIVQVPPVLWMTSCFYTMGLCCVACIAKWRELNGTTLLHQFQRNFSSMIKIVKYRLCVAQRE